MKLHYNKIKNGLKVDQLFTIKSFFIEIKNGRNRDIYFFGIFGDGDTLSYIEKLRKSEKKEEKQICKTVPVPKKLNYVVKNKIVCYNIKSITWQKLCSRY